MVRSGSSPGWLALAIGYIDQIYHLSNTVYLSRQRLGGLFQKEGRHPAPKCKHAIIVRGIHSTLKTVGTFG